MPGRYHVEGDQARFEPGSNECVLANKLGIVDSDEMDYIEFDLLNQLYESVLVGELPDRALQVSDLKIWHRRWLGKVYRWAGEERSVNMGKAGFQFAAAAQINRLLGKFQYDCLDRYTPCCGMDLPTLTEGIAITHVEFILIHPFREGNGRLGRLLGDVMAVQSGRDSLDYKDFDADRQRYFAAIQAGLACDYEPIKDLVRDALSA